MHVSRRRTLLALLSSLLLALTLAVTVGGAASASGRPTTNPGHEGFGYLALGDSVPFGYRPFAATPPATYLDARNFVGYPEIVGQRTGLTVANASCPGETTASFLDATAQSNGCEDSLTSETGYRDNFPLHVAYDGSQLDYAVAYLRGHPRTREVTLMVGANDLFVCQRTTPDRCAGASFPQLLATVSAHVDTILSTLRDEAKYRHRITLVTYYSTNYADPVTTGGIAALNDALVKAARANGAVVADGFGAFRDAAASSGGDACRAGLLIPLPTGGCDIHPTRAGQEVLADAVLAAPRR